LWIFRTRLGIVVAVVAVLSVAAAVGVIAFRPVF
jgi:hypothetical protein